MELVFVNKHGGAFAEDVCWSALLSCAALGPLGKQKGSRKLLAKVQPLPQQLPCKSRAFVNSSNKLPQTCASQPYELRGIGPLG